MAQKRTQAEKPDPPRNEESSISICDIMHSSANDIIGKMESLLPVNIQMYSDFYSEYLHSLQDLFGACYIAENEILSRFGINQKALQSFRDYSRAITKSAVTQIDVANNIQKAFLQVQISAIKTSDEYIHLMLDYYSRTLATSLGAFRKG